MAEVFLARVREGPRAGMPVAVKRLLPVLARDPEYVALFTAEARLAARLHHPAIVKVLEIGTHGGELCMVMEYVDGCDLARLLAACKAKEIQLPVDFALYVAHVVAQALHAAHGALGDDGRPLGLVHCDVSPSNVFVSRQGEVKLGDFGVARAVGESRSGAFGKVRYLSPEQLRSRPVGPRTDVFGLGTVLFELLTGRSAFPNTNPDDIVQAILVGERRPPSAERPGIPPEVDALVLRALAASEEKRFPDAGALADDLATRYDPAIGNPLAIAALVRGVIGA
jgi:serine/threonine protein kinase